MRALFASFLAVVLASCASMQGPKPLSGAEVVALAKSGKSTPDIIQELERTNTVLALQASDIVGLHEAGVPREVLDYLQRRQIDEIRWRDRYSYSYWYGSGFYRPIGACPWPPYRYPYRGGPWC